jgi:uncharacterized membrane protein YbhN (UPF0104 family)
MIFFRGVLNSITFSRKDNVLTYRTGFKLAAIHTLGNYLPIPGGLLAKGYLLKKSHGINYKLYSFVTLYTFVAGVAAGGLVGLAAYFLLDLDQHSVLFLLSSLSACLLFIFIPYSWGKCVRHWLPIDKLQQARNEFIKILPPFLLIVMVNYLLNALTMMLLLGILGVNESFLVCTLLTSVLMLSRLLAITPGAIGIREALAGGMAFIIGVDFQSVILALAIDRIIEIIMLGLSYQFSRNIK